MAGLTCWIEPYVGCEHLNWEAQHLLPGSAEVNDEEGEKQVHGTGP